MANVIPHLARLHIPIGATRKWPLSGRMSGDVLLSHPVARAVPSAQKGLASGFGMGPGVSPSPWSPKLYGDVGLVDRTPGTAQWTRAAAGEPAGDVCGKSSAY